MTERGSPHCVEDVLIPWDAPTSRPWSVRLGLTEVSIESLATEYELHAPCWHAVSGPHALPVVGRLTFGDRLRLTVDARGGRAGRRVRLVLLQPVRPAERSGPDAGSLPGVLVRIFSGTLELGDASHRPGSPPRTHPKVEHGPVVPEGEDA